jgi:hypothetical protein
MPFQVGQVANPLGRGAEVAHRVVEKRFYNALTDILKEQLGKPPARKTRLHAVCAKLVRLATDGDVVAIKEIANRLDGPIPLPTLSAPDGTPISPYGSAQEPTSAMLVVRWGEPQRHSAGAHSDSSPKSDSASALNSPQAQPRSDPPPVLELEAEELPMLELRGPQST